VEAFLGDKDKALDYLQQCVSAGFEDAGKLSADPAFATLRNHDGFVALLAALAPESFRQRVMAEVRRNVQTFVVPAPALASNAIQNYLPQFDSQRVYEEAVRESYLFVVG